MENGEEVEILLQNVLYEPNYEVNRSVKLGHKFIFKESEAKLMLNHGPKRQAYFIGKSHFKDPVPFIPLQPIRIKEESKAIFNCGINVPDI